MIKGDNDIRAIVVSDYIMEKPRTLKEISEHLDLHYNITADRKTLYQLLYVISIVKPVEKRYVKTGINRGKWMYGKFED